MKLMTPIAPPYWDIFCTVVDNYGDIGVTWRLARQLANEYQLPVRLWVDDLQAFVPLCPEADASAAQQVQQGVEVRQWPVQLHLINPNADYFDNADFWRC